MYAYLFQIKQSNFPVTRLPKPTLVPKMTTDMELLLNAEFKEAFDEFDTDGSGYGW